jgi:hypothetical protein
MKLTDHESDHTAAARLASPPPTESNPVRHESWLDKLARHLGAIPVDHMPIIPRDLPAAACCATADGS